MYDLQNCKTFKDENQDLFARNVIKDRADYMDYEER